MAMYQTLLGFGRNPHPCEIVNILAGLGVGDVGADP
jgi:hypothetical protein